ncbi:MAG: hypothetical protein WCP06_07265 [Verrucomicrobiota bacterium]
MNNEPRQASGEALAFLDRIYMIGMIYRINLNPTEEPRAKDAKSAKGGSWEKGAKLTLKVTSFAPASAHKALSWRPLRAWREIQLRFLG